jgi:predicted metal-dependent hydrolase
MTDPDRTRKVPAPAFAIRRSTRARRARLTVTADGGAVVVLPVGAPERVALELVERHGVWLARQTARIATERRRLLERPTLDGGRVLMVHGIPHRVRILDAGGRPGVERTLGSDADGLVGELVVRAGSGRRSVATLVERWLRAEAARVVGERVRAHAERMELTPGRMTIRAQRSRWGSASRDGSLSFNWRLLLTPPFVLDAVVVHELAHLRWRGHGVRFWSLARRHAPRTDEARAWLRAHHAELMAALD